jgi:hypothetical protein
MFVLVTQFELISFGTLWIEALIVECRIFMKYRVTFNK